MTLVILAAGMGSRYGGLKQLDPMTENGEFIIDFSIYDAKRAGFDRVCFIIKKENEELFKETVGKRMEKQMEVVYAYQELSMLPAGYAVPEGRVKPWGTGHALLCARDAVGDDCMMVLNADDFYGADSFFSMAEFLKNAGEGQFAMSGFILKNTLTENGSVSRGICEIDPEGYLLSVTERTKIYRDAAGNTVFEEDGKVFPTDENSCVSMNCWGFTPDIFRILEEEFGLFLKADGEDPSIDPLKREFYLPKCVDTAMKKGRCHVKVLPSHSKWYGVTYPEDKPKVAASIKEMIRKGEYPKALFS